VSALAVCAYKKAPINSQIIFFQDKLYYCLQANIRGSLTELTAVNERARLIGFLSK